MLFRRFAQILALTSLAVISGAQTITNQAALARDFAAKAYLRSHPAAKQLPDRVLVRFTGNSTGAERASARAAVQGLTIRKYTIVPGLELIDSPLGADRAMEVLKANPHVVFVEPDHVAQLAGIPNDPEFGNLWGMNQGNDVDVNAPQAWNMFTGDPNFLIADFDSGINYDHPDLTDNVWTNPGEVPGNGIDDDGNGYIDDVHGYDFVNEDGDPADDNSHGSHTAGIIGARGNNATGVVGINWRCKIVSIKAFNPEGKATEADIIEGMQYLSQTSAKVSNHSWAGGAMKDGSDWPALYEACQALQGQGHLMVCAAGNDNIDNDASTIANVPASFNLPNIVSVVSIDSSGAKASSSSYGATSCDLGAPGVSIESTVLGTGYAYYSGTSMATPHVTGGAALLWGLHPNLTYSKIKNRILITTKPLASLAGITVTGGMLNLGSLITNYAPIASAGTDQTIEATGSSTSFQLDASGSYDEDADTLTYYWSEGVTPVGTGEKLTLSRGLGSYTFDVVAADAFVSRTDSVDVTIQDTKAPAFDALSDVYATATGNSGATVTFDSPTATDLVDGSITGTCVPASGSLFAPGDTLVNVSATDLSGNTGTASFHVFVSYSWSGFKSPFPKQKYNSGSTIPVKFALTDGNSGITDLVANAYWAPLDGGVPGSYTLIGTFRYDTLTKNYIVNWSTKGLTKGTYRIKADLGDGLPRTVDVILK